MPKLFVCEKKSQAQHILHAIENDDVIILCPTIGSYLYDYPNNLGFSNLPYTNYSPRYKTESCEHNSKYRKLFRTTIISKKRSMESPLLLRYYTSLENGIMDDIERVRAEVLDFLSGFDEVIFACDPDYTGVRGFDLLFENYFGIKNLKEFSENTQTLFTASIFNFVFTGDCMSKAIETRSDFFLNQSINKFRIWYKKKDFFEFNYNLNSLLTLNKAYLLAYGTYPNFLITKNVVLVAFMLSGDSMDISKLIHKLSEKEIGTPASRNEIIERMCDASILKLEHDEISGRKTVRITKEGLAFLGNLHRKVNDPFLSERLYNDFKNYDLSLDAFKEKYSKYLSVVFSKQKRFINKLS